MTGLILVGHGNFASGMHSALRLLNGECEGLVSIDFQEGTSFEDLCEQLNKEIDKFENDKVIILTDLPGGSPFKAAALATFQYDHVKALTGINFPVLMEIALSKDYTEDIDQLIAQSIVNAREALMEIKLEA
ncbi:MULTISPECIES: PTS sugar transporter subunit IIA [Bacillota]|jgi:PTS system N-acetylgalactosamine-specific IIA component|uniref:PTS sugar transporter subunit IIA n=2 Tax=Amedibacillus TaxID=2749846 RepID=A0A7G9GSW2_9FIRM|nr:MULTISPECIES: PTS sugar transporter subunit IIA [Bacillota]QNM13894.1 PTS sugar transporter subunit IIA [[Eubacterium] hominis]MCH4283921.1 PTS sugar transporter subunit IIA [Amedibacillus hominis]RGB56805.1 PTS sugar transporter subunit IIA [Absiella sp. AM22-9]RGB60755.1 PTS sugar transporter subunit IIA [Absiella sp. AM10-20]RGB69232.1 PTS sugar transporter subunit IIA [Absiella sp. AM09-45]